MRKVAIDSGPLSSGHAVRGIGVYTRELLKALNLDGVDVSKTDISHYDVVHFTSFKPFEISIPISKPQKTKFVLTIYDLIPLIYPKHYPPGIRGWINWQANKLLIRRNVDAIITISETSKKDICRFMGINPDKIHVTYLAASSLYKRGRADDWKLEISGKSISKKFALYVGDVNYNKNIPNLVKACRLAEIPLVISGKQAFGIEKMNLNHPELRHLKGVDWSGVIRTGYTSDEVLADLYQHASVYIQPSYYEGFGLPLLEAYACKTPIAVAKNQCHVEILGDDFEYFDPSDPKDIAKAIINPNKDKQLPRKYSWEQTSNETLKVYESI